MLSPQPPSNINSIRSASPFPLVATLLCVLVTLVWLPALNASFQFDDWNVIVNDARVQSLSAWLHSMPGIRPLLKFSYAFNHTLNHEPVGFRLFNVCVHAANAVLVYSLFVRKSLQWNYNHHTAHWAGLLTGLIFALHPVQTEAVTYLSGRSTSLVSLFSLLSLDAWSRSELATTARAQRRWLTLCCVALLLAVAVKETATALPLLLWLWSASQSDAALWPRRLWIPALVGGALLLAVLCLPAYQHLVTFSLTIRPLIEQLLTQGHALLYLGGQLLRIENMNADPQLAAVTHFTALTTLLSCVWLGLVIISLQRIRQHSAGAFAVLWFLICLLPTHSLLARLDVVNDRQLYLALAGPAWWLALHVAQLFAIRSKMAVAATCVLLATLAFNTLQRNEIYTTEISFWEATAAQNPANARAANNLGLAYAIACRRQAALREFTRAATLDPQDFHARINLVLLQRDQLPGVPQRCTD